MKTKLLMLGAGFASMMAVAALAHGGATGVVKERMDGMGAMQEAMKVLTPMMQGQSDYDPDVVRAQASIIATHAGDALTSLFPEGSVEGPSEAKAEIWQDWEGFATLAEQLRSGADGLASAAGNGLMMSGDAPAAGMMDQGGMMGGGMMGGMMDQDIGAMDFAQMPADGAFMMMGQACAACHTRFRAEKK